MSDTGVAIIPGTTGLIDVVTLGNPGATGACVTERSSRSSDYTRLPSNMIRENGTKGGKEQGELLWRYACEWPLTNIIFSRKCILMDSFVRGIHWLPPICSFLLIMKLDGASSVLCRPTQITNPSSLFEQHNVEITDRIKRCVDYIVCSRNSRAEI